MVGRVVAPRERVRGREVLAVQADPLGLEAEPVQPEAFAREVGEDHPRSDRVLAAAHRPHADELLLAEVHACALVELRAVEVVAERPALEHGDERQLRCERAQLDEVLDRAAEVLDHREVRTGKALARAWRSPSGENPWLAHPILRRRPEQPTDLIAEAAHLSDVLPRRHRPAPVLLKLREAARVEAPRSDRAR